MFLRRSSILPSSSALLMFHKSRDQRIDYCQSEVRERFHEEAEGVEAEEIFLPSVFHNRTTGFSVSSYRCELIILEEVSSESVAASMSPRSFLTEIMYYNRIFNNLLIV